MEDNLVTEKLNKSSVSKQFTTVTPLSKYLALLLFIAMPFIGGYIGYKYSPEKIIERVIYVPLDNERTESIDTQITNPNRQHPEFSRTDCSESEIISKMHGYSFSYPCNWILSSDGTNIDFTNRGIDDADVMGGDTFIENYNWNPEEPSPTPENHHSLYLIIYKVENGDNLSIDEYFLKPYEKYYPNDIKLADKFVTSYGIEGRTYVTENSEHPVGLRTVITVFKSGKEFYVFQSSEQSIEYHKQILKSFNFINS